MEKISSDLHENKHVHMLKKSTSRRRCSSCYKILRERGMSAAEACLKAKKVFTRCDFCEKKPYYCHECYLSYCQRLN